METHSVCTRAVSFVKSLPLISVRLLLEVHLWASSRGVFARQYVWTAADLLALIEEVAAEHAQVDGLTAEDAQAPKLESDFDPARLYLADLDGSGCANLVYVDFDRVHFWFNRSGNSWSEAQVIYGTPPVTNATAVQFGDIFGTGTTSVVWSYDFDQQHKGNYKVLDFCGGVKPYLLVEMSNNLGATTRVRYAPSTKYALEDEAKGPPWISKLSFPVQVVDKVEVIDHISKTKLVTTYKYHHGYFDGREREFRGFGRVDHFDTESFESFSPSRSPPGGGPVRQQSRAPPCLPDRDQDVVSHRYLLRPGQTILGRYPF